MDESSAINETQPSESQVPNLKITPIKVRKDSKTKLVPTEDKRKTGIGRFNAVKNLKYAQTLMANMCNDCMLRPKEEGGSIGGCEKYAKDSVCTVKKDYIDLVEKYDTRDPNKLKELLSDDIKDQMVRVAFARFVEVKTGGAIDKVVRAEKNLLLEEIELMNKLNSSVMAARQTEKYNEKGMLTEIMKEVLVKRQAEQAKGE